MTSLREFKCEDPQCGSTWSFFPEHVCPDCSKQQFRNGQIFDYFKERLKMRVSRYGELEIPDEAKDYLEKCCECIEDLEELRLRYESDCAYREGRKRLRGLDSVGNEYFFLMQIQSFDTELFDIPDCFLKHV